MKADTGEFVLFADHQSALSASAARVVELETQLSAERERRMAAEAAIDTINENRPGGLTAVAQYRQRFPKGDDHG